MTVSPPIEPTQETPNTATKEKTSPWALVACSSWLAGQKFEVKSKRGSKVIKVGRGSHCDIIFPGTHLSREHVEIRIQTDHMHIQDLGSVNGTFINEVRVTEGILRPGDKLRLDVYSFNVTGPKPEAANDTPNTADIHATKLRSQAPPAAPTLINPKQPQPKKQWVEKPTSPGNRIEQTSAHKPKASLRPLWIATIGLLVATAALVAYLLL